MGIWWLGGTCRDTRGSLKEPSSGGHHMTALPKPQLRLKLSRTKTPPFFSTFVRLSSLLPPIIMTTAVPTLSEGDLTALLNRISQKNTVQSLIILDRSSGAIIRSSGSVAAHRDSESLVGEYAGMVWNFVKSAEEMVCGMDEQVNIEKAPVAARAPLISVQDDLKLLRVRTKRHELVIVPGKPYAL